MKRYYFYLIEEDFYDLFKGDNLKAFLELFYRKEDSSYYEKQFSLFVKEIDNSELDKIVRNKYECRKDFRIENNKYILNNFITSSEEIMKIYHNYIYVETDYEVSPFVSTLGDNFPDLVCIDVNNYKIERVGLVS
jgi:hypothetical protein